jgi:hypothetical protein
VFTDHQKRKYVSWLLDFIDFDPSQQDNINHLAWLSLTGLWETAWLMGDGH